MARVDLQTARAAKRTLAAKLSGNPAVNGVGIQPVDGGYRLEVKLAKPAREVPDEVDGVEVHSEIMGAGFPERL